MPLGALSKVFVERAKPDTTDCILSIRRYPARTDRAVLRPRRAVGQFDKNANEIVGRIAVPLSAKAFNSLVYCASFLGTISGIKR